MDWFHCNRCFRRSGTKFAVSSCGHISCDACVTSEQCNICGSSCSYLPITDEMKLQEKMFFKDPVKLIQSQLEHNTQIALFQRAQTERVTAHFKHKCVELERRLKEFSDQCYRQQSELKRENAEFKKQILELKRENAELKKPLSQRRVSPGQFYTNGTQRVSLPVAVTSPVTPRSHNISHTGSAGSHGWIRDRVRSLAALVTPGSAVSSRSSIPDHGINASNFKMGFVPLFQKGTPTFFNTPTRIQQQTPSSVFTF